MKDVVVAIWIGALLVLGFVMLFGCGEINGSPDDPPVVEQIAPITYDQVMEKRWVAPVDGAFLTVELEGGMVKYDDDGAAAGDYRGFHLRVCETAACDTPELFFAHGEFAIESTNDLCLKDIRIYNLPPQEYHYQPITRLGENEYTTADFCVKAKMAPNGQLKAVARNENGERFFDFDGSPLPVYE